MAKSDLHLVSETGEVEQQFRMVMGRLAGGVSIITAGDGRDIAGTTTTSLTSLSAAPPRLLVSINRAAACFALIERTRIFGVNILGSYQYGIAGRFKDERPKLNQGFEGLEWRTGQSGAPLLKHTSATIECAVEEIIDRHSHGIIVGRSLSFELSPQFTGLAYWNGEYIEMERSGDLDLLAEVSIPLNHVR